MVRFAARYQAGAALAIVFAFVAIAFIAAGLMAGAPAEMLLAVPGVVAVGASRRYPQIVQQLADLKRQDKELHDEASANLATLEAVGITADTRKAALKRDDEIHTKRAGLHEQIAALEAEKAAFDRQHAAEAGTRPAAVLRASTRGDSKPLSVSNVWRAVMAGGMGNRVAMQTYAGEELAISDRLREAGYQPTHLGSMLMPLHADLIMEPIDEQGNPVGDISALKTEIRERMALGRAVDPGELGWLVRRHPSMAMALGFPSAADMQVGDDTLGGVLIPPTQSDTVFDLFRARSTVTRAGATIVPLPPSGNIAYPRLKGDPDFAWSDPDTEANAATTRPQFGMVRMAAKSLRGFVGIPNDLIRYSSPAVEMLVRQILAAKAAVAWDDTALQGAGSTLQPKGLINYDKSTAETPAYGKLTLHVAGPGAEGNGDTFLPEDVMKIIGLYYTGDDPDAPTGWIMRPMMWAGIANLRADAATPGDKKGPFMFWTSRGVAGSAVPEALGGHPVYSSSKVSKTRAEGGASNLTYTVFGNFARLLLGMAGVLELAVSEHILFLQDKTAIRAVLRGDVGVSHEQSFVFTDTLVEP